ncbi:hypothetical protein ACE38W_04725 [Chitinophaga sp. Hz27]|uniref:hypothetical protein n=1 Tax=Chitinophaga sp. Hz27 TaxID=3347169 RepID=UPI0035E371C1
MSGLLELYQTLEQRKRPEDVAQMIFELMSADLSKSERTLLDKAASRSLKRLQHQYTSMSEYFSFAVGAMKQIRKAEEIFVLKSSPGDYDNPIHIEKFIQQVSPIIQKVPGSNDFRHDRLNKTQRVEQGLDLSKRNYNKKWRLLKRLEAKLAVIVREQTKLKFQGIGKHGLTNEITYEAFGQDLNTACFIAYIVARGNLRSEFTIEGQQKPFDDIAAMLLRRCENKPAETQWYEISCVFASQGVLQHLTEQQKGKLLGKWTAILQEVAVFLQELWESNDFERQSMVVKRGNDSTTWNNTANTWNKARDNWIGLLYALDMEAILDEVCFGKVLRLIAADLAFYHKVSGGNLDPNTNVWNQLPLPWEVFNQTAICTREMVVDMCKKAGLDPEKSGWIAPRESKTVAFKPTPELVYGVSVGCPFLATILKKNKYYSGKNVNPLNPELN